MLLLYIIYSFIYIYSYSMMMSTMSPQERTAGGRPQAPQAPAAPAAPSTPAPCRDGHGKNV